MNPYREPAEGNNVSYDYFLRQEQEIIRLKKHIEIIEKDHFYVIEILIRGLRENSINETLFLIKDYITLRKYRNYGW